MPCLPTVSIISPSYNQVSYLEKTIRSVLDQDYPNLEYIIVDGGSTDGSVDVIKKYETRLKYWISETDEGQGDAINKGLMQAEGEILGWLNSDDLYLPGAIPAVVDHFQKNPELGLIFGDILSINSQGKPINYQRFGNWNLKDLMMFRIIGQPAVFFRRNALEKGGILNPQFHFLLDHHLWLRIARVTEIGYLQKILAAARFHSEAKNIALANEFGKDALAIVDWLRTAPEFQNEFEEMSRKILAGYHWINGRYLSEGGRAWDSIVEMARSFGQHPSFVLKDWRRGVFILLQLLGLSTLKDLYTIRRAAEIEKMLPPETIQYLISLETGSVYE